jgi:hypothetical protein
MFSESTTSWSLVTHLMALMLPTELKLILVGVLQVQYQQS